MKDVTEADGQGGSNSSHPVSSERMPKLESQRGLAAMCEDAHHFASQRGLHVLPCAILYKDR